jgi:perosamine synthetase
MMRYPIAAPLVGPEEVEAVTNAVTAGEISKGRAIPAFEAAFARLLGSGYAVSTVTGTSAIEVALRGLKLAGTEVITGAMSCQATANALLSSGCTLRFADHEEASWQVSPREVEKAITPRTRALVIAHLYGAAADLDKLVAIARRHDLLLIEDCSQSLGARWRGRPVGTFGAASSFSFYSNKLITTGEGGMVWTSNAKVAARCRMVRSYGQSAPFEHATYGLNWKMPNLLAALGLAQLQRVPELIAARVDRMRWLCEAFADDPEILMPILPAHLEPAPFCFPVALRHSDVRGVRKRLDDLGVETRPLFRAQFDQPAWLESAPKPKGAFPVARWLFEHGFYLSAGPHMSKADYRFIAKSVKEAIRAKAVRPRVKSVRMAS